MTGVYGREKGCRRKEKNADLKIKLVNNTGKHTQYYFSGKHNITSQNQKGHFVK